MALSGSFSSSIASGHYELRVDWSATQNITNNTSKITAVMYLVNDWSINVNTRASTTTIAGATYNWTAVAVKNSTGSTHTTKLGTVTSGSINHNTDGTKKIKISATYNIKATIDGTYYESITASAEVDLDDIPRATQPTLSVTSADMGDRIKINTPRASSAFTHDLAYSFAGRDYVGIATGVAEYHNWTIPDLATEIPDANSGLVTIRCITKNGSTVIGTTPVLLTAKVPASVMPTISSVTTKEATSRLADQFGVFIQGRSTIETSITASGAKGSTIKSYSTTFEGKTYTGSSWTSGAISGRGTLDLVTTVTDSRERTAKKTTSISVLAYTKPKTTAFKAQRCTSGGVVDDQGTYVKLTLAYSVTSLGGKNTAAVKVEYKLSNASDYTELSSTTGDDLSANRTELPKGVTFSVDYQYDFRLTVTDYFGESSTYTSILPSGAVIMDIKADGLGIAFGKTADKNGADFGWSPKGAVLGLQEVTSTIPAGADLNDYVIPGVYAIQQSIIFPDVANTPPLTTGVAGTLRVWCATGKNQLTGAYVYMMQEYVPYDATYPSYRRLVSTDGTGAWRKPQEWVQSTLKRQTTLWSGSLYMIDNQTVTLSEAISAQNSGIVLGFSGYIDGTAQDYWFNECFVPKQCVRLQEGKGHTFPLFANSIFSHIGAKYLYISDTKIIGDESNALSGTKNGITYDNSKFVLRYVIGV